MGTGIRGLSAFPEADESLEEQTRGTALGAGSPATPSAFPIDQTDRLGAGMADQTTPDTASRIFKLQLRTGFPVDYIKDNLDTVEKEATAADFDPDAFRRSSPQLAKWLESHELHGPLAKDDLVPLTGMETALRFGGKVVGRVKAGYYGASAGLYGAVQSFVESARKEGAREIERALIADGVSVTEARRRRLEVEAAPDETAMTVAGIRQSLERTANQKRGDTGGEGLIERGVLGAVESVTQVGLLLPASIATRSPAPMLAGMGTISYGSSYGEARDAGKSIETATGFAAFNAAVEVGTEAIPASKLIGNLGKGWTKQIFEQLASEIPGEQVATLLQDFSEWTVLHPEKTGADFLAERPGRAAETLISTVVATAIQSGGVAALDRSSRAKQGEKFVRDLGQAAAGSQLRTTNPEKFGEFVAEAAAANGVRTLYQPIDDFTAYARSKGIDPVKWAADLTGSPTAYADAQAGKVDLSIPIERFAVKVAGTEHNAFFAKSIRLGPLEDSATDAEARDAIEQAMAEQPEGARPPTEAEVLRAAVTQQLEAAQFAPATAAGLAGALESGIGSLAQRAGVDPREVYAGYGLQVRRMTQREAEEGGHGAQRAEAAQAGPVTEQQAVDGSAEGQQPPAGAPPVDEAAEARATVLEEQGLAEPPAEPTPGVASRTEVAGRARGDRFVVYDAEGKRRPIVGAKAASYQAAEGETFGVEGPDGFRVIQDRGGAYTSERESDGDRTQAGERPRDGDTERAPADVPRGTEQGRGDGSRAQRRRLQAPHELDDLERQPGGFEPATAEADAARLTPETTRELERIADELNEFPFTARTWSWLGAGEGKTGNAAGGEANIVAGAAGAKVYDDVLQFAPLSKGKGGKAAKMVRGTRAQLEVAIRKALSSGRISNNLMEGAVRVAERRAADDYRYIARPELPPSWGVEVDPQFVEDLSDAIDQGGDDSFDPKTFGQGLFDVLDQALAQEAPKAEPSPTSIRKGSTITLRQDLGGMSGPSISEQQYVVERFIANRIRLVEVGADPDDRTRDLYTSLASLRDYVQDGTVTEINGMTAPEFRALLEQRAAADKAGKVDRLDTGEQQPRLPEAGAVREADIQTPEVADAPFALTPTTSKAPRGKQRTLFQSEDAPPIATLGEQVEQLDLLPDASNTPDSKVVPFPQVPLEFATALHRARDRMSARQTTVTLGDLISTQPTISAREVVRALEQKQRGEVWKPIEVLAYDGKLYIADGTHRSVATWARGETEIRAIVTAVDPAKVSSPPLHTTSLDTGGPIEKTDRTRFAGGPTKRRGSYHIDENRQVTINLFENADLSTFIHEMGHFFLQIQRDLAAHIATIPEADRSDTQRQLLADVAAIDEWAADATPTGDQTLEEAREEKFARGFENYVGEGKAPSLALREAFSRFRAWILSVYRSLKALDAPLDDRIRAVFDRMLATDDAIAGVEQSSRIAPMFLTAEAAGMTPEQWAIYEQQIGDASRSTRERLDQKLQAEVRRELTAAWEANRNQVRGEVEKEVHAEPIYQALAAMQKGTTPAGEPLIEGQEPEPLKLSKAIIVERFGKDRLRFLPRPYIYSAEGGLDPDAVAQRFGFLSGDGLLTALTTVEPMDRRIDRITERRMLAEHGSMLLDGSIVEEAQAAHADEVREGVVRAELRALQDIRRKVDPFVKEAEQTGRRLARDVERERDYERRWLEAEAKLRIAIAEGHKQVEIDKLEATIRDLKAKQRGGAATIDRGVPNGAQLRDFARERVARMFVQDLKPAVYWSASRRAAQQAIDHAARGQYAEAIEAKTRELVNLAIYREMERTREDVDARVRQARHIGTPAGRQMLAFAGDSYLDQIDGILDRYEFARVTRKVLERRASIRDFVAGLEAQGRQVNLPAEVLNDARRVNYQAITVEELIGITDGIAQIIHLARFKNQLLKKQQARELDQVTATLSGSIRNNKPSKKDQLPSDRRTSEERKRTIGDFFAGHRKLASLLREMDGFEDGGPMVSEIMFRLNEAGAEEATRQADASSKFAEIVERAFPGRKKRDLYTRRVVPAIGRPMSRMQRITVALNWGNEGNRQRIRDGLKFTDAQVQAILDTLTAEDLRFAQDVLDFLDSFWPEIEAKQKRVDGLAPEKVEALEIKAAAGTIRGGYYPLKYDDRLSASAIGKLDLEAANAAKQAAYTHATTKRGHVEARKAAVKEPVRLDFGVMFEHVGQVIHDLTHHETLIDIGRILGSREVSSAIIDTHGDLVYKQVRDAVRDIAFGDVGARSGFERSINHIRAGATIAGLGWNLTTAMLQPLGFANTVVRIGPRYAVQGIYRWLRNPTTMVETVRWISSVSPMMASRARTQQREINEIRQRLGVSTGRLTSWLDEAISKTTFDQVTRQGIADSYFWMIGVMQRTVDVPTWLGAYEKAMANGETEARAIKLADQAVLDSQGGGQIKDLSQVQRGGPMMKLWTNFYSFFNVLHNQAVESAKRTNYRSPAEVGKLAADYLMLFVVPATLGYMVREAIRPGDADDDDALAQRLVWETLGYAAGMMLGLREVSGALAGSFGYQGPAGARFFASLARLGKQVTQGEPDEALRRAAVDVSGTLLHLPAGQINRTLDGIVALDEGKTDNPAALMVGAPRGR